MRVLVLLIWCLALAMGLAWVTKHTHEASQGHAKLLEPPPLARLDQRFLHVLTLGYRPLYDDFVHIWTLQFLTDESLHEEDPQQVFEVIRTITRHKPRVRSIYSLACYYFAFDLEEPKYCEPITLDGLEAFPDSWLIPAVQGYVYAFKMRDIKGAARYYTLAASRPDAPDFMDSLAAKLRKNQHLTVPELKKTLKHLFRTPAGAKLNKVVTPRDS